MSRVSKPQEASFKHRLHKINSASKNKTHLSRLWQNNTDVSAAFYAAIVASTSQKLLYNTDTAGWEVDVIACLDFELS